MTQCQEETFDEFFKDAQELTEAHRNEINLFDDELDVDVEVYKQYEEIGGLKVYTMREDGNLIGYCVFFLWFHNHHKASLHAKQDVLFVKKDRRGRGTSFINFCDKQLKEFGVDVVHQCVPSSKDWSPILTRLGYTELETIYIRKL